MILSLFEKLFIGGIGGLLAFWFAHRKFISQRWWDKQFDLFVEAINILKIIEQSLATYIWAIENEKTIENSDTVEKAYLNFENGISQLNGLQSKFIMIGLDDAKSKVMILSATLSVVHPSYLTSDTKENRQELIDLFRQSKHMTVGCSGELAYLGKEKLGIEWHYFGKIKKFFCPKSVYKKIS